MCVSLCHSECQAGLPREYISGLGAQERAGDLPHGGTMGLQPRTGQSAGPGGPLRSRVCVCTCVSTCPAGSRALSSPSWVWATQTLSSAMTLSPLNICCCDGSGAGLVLRAFKALLMLSKQEEDFDTDCQTSKLSSSAHLENTVLHHKGVIPRETSSERNKKRRSHNISQASVSQCFVLAL